MLETIFPNRLISRFSDVPWAPRSPDLTRIYFFICGYLKGIIYINIPRDLHELKESIIQEICNVTPYILRKVMKTVVRRIRLCLNNNGGRLNDIILKEKLENFLFCL